MAVVKEQAPSGELAALPPCKAGRQVDDSDSTGKRTTTEGLLDHGKSPRRLVGEVPRVCITCLLEASACGGKVSPATRAVGEEGPTGRRSTAIQVHHLACQDCRLIEA